jgi:hypothetical protein
VNNLRKVLGALLAMLGAYYCVLSLFTLARLPAVTTRWVQASGDPDFKYDYGLFLMLIGSGAVWAGIFGLRSASKGVAAARGQRESWLALAIGAPFLHWFWFLFRLVGTGQLDRTAASAATRYHAARFAIICLAYLAMWLVMRRPRGRTSPDQAAPAPSSPALTGPR